MKKANCSLPLLLLCCSLIMAQDVYNAIRNTLAHYPLAIDGKQFSDLSLVFTPDAVANYSAPLNVLTGLPMIESTLEANLRPVSTQHAYGTQLIEIHENKTADTVTYYMASHFGAGLYEGSVYYAYGKYVDHLIETEAGWRIDKRHLIYMGAGQGNILIFTGLVNATGSPSS